MKKALPTSDYSTRMSLQRDWFVHGLDDKDRAGYLEDFIGRSEVTYCLAIPFSAEDTFLDSVLSNPVPCPSDEFHKRKL